MYLYSIVIALLLTFHFFPIYNVYRDRIVHFVTERSDPVKKYNCLLALLVSVFLLLCACAQQQSGQASSDPDTLSSTPSSSTPASSVPASSVPATSAPIRLSTDWVVKNREIVPFEDRFKENVPFEVYSNSWLVHQESNEYRQYSLSRRNKGYPLEVMYDGNAVYTFPSDRNLDDYSLKAADGQWAYFTGDNQLIRIDMLTGESSVITEFSTELLKWYVWACGKDTACVVTLDQDYLLHYYYLDFHTGATKDLYKDTIPATPLEDMVFYRPGSTPGEVQWIMMNPDFYEVLKKELGDPDSPFRTQSYYSSLAEYWDYPERYEASIESMFWLCVPIQNHYDIPARVKYVYNPKTGELLPDYGIVCSCQRGTGQGHDHYNYEITAEEVPEILNVEPVDVPNLTKLTQAQAEAALNTECTSWRYYDNLYSDFGHRQPYLKQGGIFTKIADISVIDMVIAADYAYCITPEGTIIQLSLDGQICNTIYEFETPSDFLFYWKGCLYFTDNSTIICIDTINGTQRPILRTKLIEIYINGEYDDGLYFGIRQGLYCQEYRFYPDTGVLEEESYI